jgi:acetyl/propionyl-CoA carboxylase alpha subunit
VINQDLEALHKWGLDNKTTFEPEKMCVMVISQKKKPFDPSGIVFAGEELSVHDDTTLVGLKIDNRMRWGPMVAKLATKARQRIGALYRIRHLLNSQNLKTMYMMFIRSIMEYNSVCWMGAAKSHLSSLDRIQHTAERMCGFTAEPLQARRDAAAMSFALKLLDGKTRGELKHFVPKLIEPLRLCKKRTRHTLEGTQVASKVRSNSLDVYKRGFVCALPEIWSRIPIEIINKGAAKGWLKIKNACSDFLTGKSKTPSLKKRKVSEKTETYSTKLNNELNGNVEI